MDRKITARLNMANAVKEVCDNNTSVVALVPALVALVVLLKDRITELKAIMKRITLKKKGLKKDKDEWEVKLAFLLSIVCGSGASYGRKIKDVVMEENFSLAQSTLEGMRNTELIEAANVIIDMQSEVAAQMIEYGITTAFMDEVKLALKNFEEKNPKPIVNIYTTEADNEEAMTKAFELSDFVLRDMMKAALIYKALNLNFYNSLKNASRISKVGVHHDEDPVAAAAKKEAKENKSAEKKAAKHASGEPASTEKKDVQESPNTQEMLKDAMDTMNTNAENVSTESPDKPTLNGAAKAP